MTALRVLNVEQGRYDAAARARLEAVAHVTWADCAGAAELAALLRGDDFDALFVRIGLRVDDTVLDAGPSLRWVVTPTTGVDHLDLGAMERRGVTLVALTGEAVLEQVSSTAEHAWALLLAAVRGLPRAHASVLDGGWQRTSFVATELRGRCLGIVGYGRLGRMVARYGSAFGMEVLVNDIDPATLARAPEGVSAARLEDLFDACDVLSLHLPLRPGTERFLSHRRIRRLRRGAVLVNTARGELVDEAALLDALLDGHIGAAGLDVLAGDPAWPGVVPAGHPLVRYAAAHDNLVLTPHVGGCGRDAIAMTRSFVVDRFCESVEATQAAVR